MKKKRSRIKITLVDVFNMTVKSYERIDAMDQRIDSIDSRLGRVENDITGVKKDVSQLKDDVAGIKGNMATKADVARIERLHDDMRKVKTRLKLD